MDLSMIPVMRTSDLNRPMPIDLYEILAQLPDGLVALDQRGVVTAYNDNAVRLLATLQRGWNGRLFLDVIAGSPLEIDLRALLAPPIVAATHHLIYECADDMRAVELRLCPLYADDPGTGARAPPTLHATRSSCSARSPMSWSGSYLVCASLLACCSPIA